MGPKSESFLVLFFKKELLFPYSFGTGLLRYARNDGLLMRVRWLTDRQA
jgi:hypothetical protein